MIILGVDPGSQRTGYGAILTDGRRHHLVESGVLVALADRPLSERLRVIHAALAECIVRLEPSVLAVEDLFHAKSARSALVLGHVRGAVLLAGAQAGLVVSAFPPATVKQQVTGFGRASKEQVALMVTRLLRLSDPVRAGDASDALAVALCHAHLHGIAAVHSDPTEGRPAARRSAAAATRLLPQS